MDAETIATFEDSLERLSVSVTRTDPEAFAADLRAAAREPAVGVPLPAGPALPEWVDTDPTPAALDAAATGVTGAKLGIADYGSVVIEATAEPTEQVSLFPELHVAVLRAGDVVPSMADAFEWFGPRLRERRSSAVVATGPSATADMGELVRGAHGPEAVHVLLLEGVPEGTDRSAGGDRADSGDRSDGADGPNGSNDPTGSANPDPDDRESRTGPAGDAPGDGEVAPHGGDPGGGQG